MTFAVVDIETNGGRPGPGSITEIAVCISDGSRLLHRKEWLIRPERPVPFHITALTGIDNEMLHDAPAFAEVAEALWQMLEGHVFTAHNASFDLSHLKAAFEACGLTFKPRVLCTVRSARKCWPGLKSYALGNLCAALDIPIQNRHRAGGDVDATVLLLHQMAALPDSEKLLYGTAKRNKINLPAGLDINDIPETTGVYRFLNAAGKVLYVGKAINLRKRIQQHFYKGGGGQDLLQEVADIKTMTCGNELMALIAESAAIRQYWPPYNKAARFKARPCCLVHYNNQEGMPMLALSGQHGETRALLRFSGMAEARNALAQLLKDYDICKAMNHNSRASCGQEDCYCGTGSLQKKQIHRERMDFMLQQRLQPPEKYVLKGPGRSPEEYACVWVEQSRIMAYGYLKQGTWPVPECLGQELTPLEDHPALRAIAAAFTGKAQMPQSSYQIVTFPIN